VLQILAGKIPILFSCPPSTLPYILLSVLCLSPSFVQLLFATSGFFPHWVFFFWNLLLLFLQLSLVSFPVLVCRLCVLLASLVLFACMFVCVLQKEMEERTPNF
jgi:hypothetical protein